ncbi:hypothetical protein HYR54_09545 [Candidatus Acetothermia bacterium]|nr:hypothetical protein [Candidatus Acetothermia bacterium]MBI3460068.1 hypothetical protein [Candidatus Acetothermia bacterium]MBI3659140.1 hypothetical protein [Candidatus Acetothermia bacterium]
MKRSRWIRKIVASLMILLLVGSLVSCGASSNKSSLTSPTKAPQQLSPQQPSSSQPSQSQPGPPSRTDAENKQQPATPSDGN